VELLAVVQHIHHLHDCIAGVCALLLLLLLSLLLLLLSLLLLLLSLLLLLLSLLLSLLLLLLSPHALCQVPSLDQHCLAAPAVQVLCCCLHVLNR
jgi:hypothetical protein